MIVGVNPGYHHKNEHPDPLAAVVEAFQEAAEDVAAESGRWQVSGVVTLGKAVYFAGAGCPSDGEDVCSIRGSAQQLLQAGLTLMTEPLRLWQTDVVAVAKLLRKRFKQSTVHVYFVMVDQYVRICND